MTIKQYIVAIIIVVLAVFIGFLVGEQEAVAPEGQERIGGIATTTAPTTTPMQVRVPSKAASSKITTPSAPAMTKSGAYIVSYTTYGFVPATITIAKGKSVHFVNNSNKAMSLTAVDQNSQIYREFNQENSVGRGATFDFTFLTAGTWEYTNRNNKADRGGVVVK